MRGTRPSNGTAGLRAGIVSAMRWTRRLLVTAAVLAVASVGLALPAAAASCTFTAPTVTIEVAQGETATIARTGEVITLNGTPCEAATVTTADSIVVNATGAPTEIAIDESGGRFEPGLTPEPDGSEIEFTLNLGTATPVLRIVGGADADSIVVGADGINLNAGETTGDVDVMVPAGGPVITVLGGAGDDRLSVAGGAGTGEPSPGATLQGEDGADLLQAGTGGSAFDGGAGTDTIDYAILSGVTVDLAAGTAGATGTDTVTAVENVTGSPGNDTITGDDQANVLAGGDGNDTIDGGGEADTLLGGEGMDTASFASSRASVTVDLKAGTAEGDGADTLDGFENVVGSRKGDEIRGNGASNFLDGVNGPDVLSGGNGVDQLAGGNGNDRLFGGKGNDTLKGEDGKDQLDGGEGNDRCKGGNDPDAFVRCEHL